MIGGGTKGGMWGMGEVCYRKWGEGGRGEGGGGRGGVYQICVGELENISK